MSKQINDLLYTARWHLGEAVKKQDYGSYLDEAHDLISQAKALSITADVSEPERPSHEIIQTSYSVPEIVQVPGVRFKKRGNFRTQSGNAKGCTVHYTVSGRTRNSAIAVMNSLAKRGLGCPVMDKDGIIYVPQGFDLQRDVAYHAGSSQWKGESGMSFYMIGMEICCWGRLDSQPKRNHGPVQEWKNDGNIKAGTYELMTPEQINSLTNFILWQLDVNPEFDLDWVAGHDEIAPNRKSDPGGSLGMTMDSFRQRIANAL